MTGSSPAPQRKHHWSTEPEPARISDFLSEDRNSELSHKEALAKARALHDRVREEALRVITVHEHQLEQQRLKDEEERLRARQRIEEERLQRERQLRIEEERLRALEAQSIPKLPPKPPTPQQPAATPVANGSNATPSQIGTGPGEAARPSPASSTPVAGQVNGHGAVAASIAQTPATAPSTTPAVNPFAKAASATTSATPAANPFAKPASTTPATNPFAKPPAASTTPAANPFAAAAPVPAGQPASAPAANGIVKALAGQAVRVPAQPQTQDRYSQIHKNLKRLRAYMTEQTKSNPALKNRMGDMRRELRKTLGQLTSPKAGEKGANKKQLETVRNLLTEALNGQTPSALVDPSDYTLENREPVEGAALNGPQLPSLFLYLLNQLGKAMINQFINECAAAPKNAEPVGIMAAQVFAFANFHWRGKSLIDILMAKFRVACPVLFGYRGSEKTEQGRARLGWKKEYDQWVPEQQHTDRMKGLGVGYAAIALRDFSRTKSTNAWPPSHYWSSMASIVNTPPAEISDTQCVVLRSMIFMYEDKFLLFYGTAGIAALRKALVEFPAKAPNRSTGVNGLSVLAEVYKRDFGLHLN